MQNRNRQVEALADWMQEVRREFHRYPELPFQEGRTAQRVCDELSNSGIPFVSEIGGTGIVASLKKGTSERSIAIRAGLDALPIQETSGNAWQSANVGVSHSSGNDGHCVMLIAAAKVLAEFGDFDGTVHFVFQPGKEGAGGARAMVMDGLFERFKIDRIFGLHLWPSAPFGSFASGSGPIVPAMRKFDIELSGSSGQASASFHSSDLILAGSFLIQAMQTAVARCLDPTDPAALSVTGFHAVPSGNLIPSKVSITGNVRHFSDQSGEALEAQLRSIVDAIQAPFSCRAEVRFEDVFRAIAGKGEPLLDCSFAVGGIGGEAYWNVDSRQVMATDDFGELLREKPGYYVLMGAGGKNHDPDLYDANFDFDDRMLLLGSKFWVNLVEFSLGATKMLEIW